MTKFIFFANRSKKNDITGKQKNKPGGDVRFFKAGMLTNGEIFKVTPKTNSHKYSFLIKSKTNSHKYSFLTNSKTKDG